jgi:glyoxylase-like metal-dependent hydrolase (beta-lactamase superfamily II)
MIAQKLTRRAALASAAAVSFLSNALGARAQSIISQSPDAQAYQFNVGSFKVTTLLVGTRTVENPHRIFGTNVSARTFADVSSDAMLPADKSQFFFTPTLVDTGSAVVLFDTGLTGPSITNALAAASYTPQQVTHVVLTHMHGDHIGGLMTDGTPTFANASYITGRAEFDFWAASGNERFDQVVKPLAPKMSFLKDQDTVVSGVTSLAAFGHTPGHMGYRIDSNGQQLVLIADLANHYVWSLAYPDWEVRFDMDKPQAAASRRAVLGMLAADKIPFVGYHMPFPALGYVAPRDGGFQYVPHSYQMLLT